jgi:hypothetical protein
MGEQLAEFVDARENCDSFQTSIAIKYGIPLSQAHLINFKKVLAYWEYCQTPQCRLDHFLDMLEIKRRLFVFE